ncbi:unnamed protein product, partial [Meganyctiphanes norvegica]
MADTIHRASVYEKIVKAIYLKYKLQSKKLSRSIAPVPHSPNPPPPLPCNASFTKSDLIVFQNTEKQELDGKNEKAKDRVTSDDNQKELERTNLQKVENENQSQDDENIDKSNHGFDSTKYELVGDTYYYTDEASGQKYYYDTTKQTWVTTDQCKDEASAHSQSPYTDDEGRTYYYAENMYLCRQPDGSVYYMDEKEEWKPWKNEDSNRNGNEESAKWYFYQGNDCFYRDKVKNIVYKLNKDTNEWETFEGKLRKKRPRLNTEEEFDTSDEEEDEDNDYGDGTAPPGYKSDPNIAYDGDKYTKKDPSDGMMYEWEVSKRAWFPKLDEDFMAIYQLSYGFNPDGTKNENPLKFDDDEEEEEEVEPEQPKEKEKNKKPSWFEADEQHNTKVYVSNLPCDLTEDEFIDLMQKCGMVLKDLDNKYKIKLYKDEEGNFKGDALCTYIRRESVDLALKILDDYQVDGKGHRIKVEMAKFQLKGKYDPKLKPKKRKKKEIDKILKKQDKLLDWRPEPMRGQRAKHENVSIFHNVFDPMEFHTAMEKILVHKEAIRQQSSNFGEVKKVEIFDLNPEGVVKVTFAEVESADMCTATLNKRLYLKRILKVTAWDGKEKFKIDETEEEREARIKKWNEFLQTGDDKNETN